MKRVLLCILIIISMLLATSCGNTVLKKLESNSQAKVVDDNKKQAPPPSTVSNYKIKGVGLSYNKDLDLEFFKDLGFNTTVLSVNGLRIPKHPYKTDFKYLKSFEKTVGAIKEKNQNYILNVESGPGYSGDNNIISIFDNRQEALYYSRMIKEIIKRFVNDPNFKGVSLSFNNPDIPVEKYYNTIGYIEAKVHETYPDVILVLNLHPLFIENGLDYIPDIKSQNVILNSNIYLRGISYPGYGLGFKTSYKLNRNSSLESLQKLKEIGEKNDIEIMVSIKTPWNEKSEVFLQDMFEIIKMLDFNYKIDSGNSDDIYKFTNNERVLKLIKRHSKQ